MTIALVDYTKLTLLMLVLENLYNETFKSFLLASLFYDVIERRCNLYIYVLKSSVNKDLNK